MIPIMEGLSHRCKELPQLHGQQGAGLFHGVIQPIVLMFAAIRSTTTINFSKDQIDLSNKIHQFEQQYAVSKAQSPKRSAFGIFQGHT